MSTLLKLRPLNFYFIIQKSVYIGNNNISLDIQYNKRGDDFAAKMGW